ncbi:STAS-like domain-containing protein [Leptospira jelokensis]|uniref:DUF4325 domain-containing protein n=1 Tax=Leptospira jelokensis TaxID=2484931 RepID=A0A4Z0ZZT8_9LEPT|nr:STAS-like domain-containing protein [Leptospira jelokensis]TGL58580.1 DUF4325 domain-containing protein [Leptospira jelokensis]
MTFKIFDHIGKSGLDSDKAVRFINEVVVPNSITSEEKIVLDFFGIHNVNSSFVNALFLNLFVKFGSEIVSNRLKVINCRSNIADIVEAGIDYSFERSKELIAT